MVKKLLLLPLLLLFLLPATASAYSFNTEEYQALEDYVSRLDGIKGPISDIERLTLERDLDLAATKASYSIAMVYKVEVQRQAAYYAMRQERAEARFRAAVVRAKERVNRWYRKNRSRPGARDIAARRLDRAILHLERKLAHRVKLLYSKQEGDDEKLLLRYDLQMTRVESLVERGLFLIERIPPDVPSTQG